MRSCFQFEGLSVLDHGRSVREWYAKLRDHLLHGVPLSSEWTLPDWVRSPVLREALTSSDDRLVGLYQVYHDCGKPLCREVDSEGRQHFPEHARVSRERWLECSDGSPEALTIADLIGMDMDAHLLTPDGVAEFASRPQAAVLLLTALCELHSNARMFGGTSSTGFKIKHKRISRLGGRAVDAMSAK
jgi:hypothetical protein